MPPDPAVLIPLITAANPWRVQVDVRLYGLTAPHADTLIHDLQTPAKQNSADHLLFHNRRRPGFLIDFVLRNRPELNFPANLPDTVWSQAGGICPNAEIWTVFWPIEVNHGTRTLTVYNANQAAFGGFAGFTGGAFQYALRVTDGEAVFRVDPGGTNQNGNTN